MDTTSSRTRAREKPTSVKKWVFGLSSPDERAGIPYKGKEKRYRGR